MQKIITTKTTAYVFYAGIAIWVTGFVVGGLFQLSYVGPEYRAVTPLIYAGVLFILLTLCNLISGRVWRGHHRVASKLYDPIVYWAIVGVMATIGIAMLSIGIVNWSKLR